MELLLPDAIKVWSSIPDLIEKEVLHTVCYIFIINSTSHHCMNFKQLNETSIMDKKKKHRFQLLGNKEALSIVLMISTRITEQSYENASNIYIKI